MPKSTMLWPNRRMTKEDMPNTAALATCVVLALLQEAGGSLASTRPVTQQLVDRLFMNYSSDVFPVCKQGSKVSVNLDIALRQVIALNEREQILTANIWIRMAWRDCRLMWNESAYNGIDHFLVDFSRVWAPDITLYDSASTEMLQNTYMALVRSNGMVYYNFPTIISSVCKVNVRYFPFDTQKCGITFGSWSYNGAEVDFWNKNPTGDMDTYIENVEWTIKDVPVERRVRYYNCCPEPFPDVTFFIIMNRIQAFYVMTMLFPSVLCVAVAALVFVLPVESGEKVSLGLTVLLSLAVFLLVGTDALPPASDNFPIIGNYFSVCMVLVSLSCVWSVIVINVFYRGSDGRRMPHLIKLIVLNYLASILCSRRESRRKGSRGADYVDHVDFKADKHVVNGIGGDLVNSDDSRRERSTQDENLQTAAMCHVTSPITANPLTEKISVLNNFEERATNGQTNEDFKQEWRDLSNILDRLFLFLYILMAVISTLVFMLQCMNVI